MNTTVQNDKNIQKLSGPLYIMHNLMLWLFQTLFFKINKSEKQSEIWNMKYANASKRARTITAIWVKKSFLS